MLAYYDGLRGLIPVKIVAVREARGGLLFTLRVTGKRYPYDRGDVFEGSAHTTVPRAAIIRRCGSPFPRIGAYRWRDILPPGMVAARVP